MDRPEDLKCPCNGILYSSKKCLKEHKNTKSHKCWELWTQELSSDNENNNQNNDNEIENYKKEIDSLNEKYNILIQENEQLKRELINVKNLYISVLFDFNKY